MTEAAETVLEVFIPGPGENPEDPQDMERSEFLGAAQEALDSGVDIEVYSTDSYPSAFEECAPVAEQIEMNGIEVLPLMLVNGEVKVSFAYPTAELLPCPPGRPAEGERGSGCVRPLRLPGGVDDPEPEPSGGTRRFRGNSGG